jgi:SAM-dependent methyltransferase
MSNEKQITYWNQIAGPKWVKLGDAMDARLAAINDLLLQTCAAQPGETILDIGCGTGVTALPLANAVGPAGHVTGIDVSAPMLAVARTRCAAAVNISLLQADAATHQFGTKKFDLLASRFGVMFFTDPYAAFRNLRAALARGGRLVFACWAGIAGNPHWQIPFDRAVAELGPPEPKHPRAPGPMAFSDPAYVSDILAQAGFDDIVITATPVFLIGETIAEEARVACLMGPAGALLDEKQASDELRAKLTAGVAAAFDPFDTPAGPRLPATIHLVQAR